jgi:hypothetical protein
MGVSHKQGYKSRGVDVLIDKRKLLEKARERHLSLQMVEKDYCVVVRR